MDIDSELRPPNLALPLHGDESSGSSVVSSRPAPQRPSSPDFPPVAPPEMPPWLTKCIKLLSAHTAEANEELSRMLDDVLDRRQKADENPGTGPQTSVVSKLPTSKAGAGKIAPVGGKKPEVQKPKPPRPVDAPPPVKKVKKSPSPPSSSKMRSPEYPVVALPGPMSSLESDIVLSSGTSGEQHSGDGEEDSEVTDLSALLGGDDSSCCICLQPSVSAGNGILKCNECGQLYHQMCHKPPVAGVNPDDPRLVWYCASCDKKMKKTSDKADVVSLLKPTNAGAIPLKKTSSSSSSTSSSSQLFRRTESKPANTSAQSGGVGLAKLASTAKASAKTRPEKPEVKKAKMIDGLPPPRKL